MSHGSRTAYDEVLRPNGVRDGKARTRNLSTIQSNLSTARGHICQGQSKNDSVKSAGTLCRNLIKTRYVSTMTIISNQQGYGNCATAGSATGCQPEERGGPICTSGPRLTKKFPATLTGTTGVNRQGKSGTSITGVNNRSGEGPAEPEI